MKAFAHLLETLALTPSRNRKMDCLAHYFQQTPDPDRGVALALLTHTLNFSKIQASKIREVVSTRVDPHLFQLSYDYVGDLAETVALIWPERQDGPGLPSLGELAEELQLATRPRIPEILTRYFSLCEPHERWALIKMVTGGFRIGVSARLAKASLAQMSGQSLEAIESIWHGLAPPYLELFAWLEGRAPKPLIKHSETFHPLMLAVPVDEAKDLPALDPEAFVAEWKWDGIRVQLVMGSEEKALYSRTGDDISHTFPDVLEAVQGEAVLDGELLVGHAFEPLPFNHLQQRLNRKRVDAKLLESAPAFVRVYDILFEGDTDLRGAPLTERRKRLEHWLAAHAQTRLDLSPTLDFRDWDHLRDIRVEGAHRHGHEGVMIKRKDSTYVAGRPKGLWFKWKRHPLFADAILMYAQRGHGKRSSFYSDYTFGVWRGEEIVPIGKAYFGFTDEELKALDRFVRTHTVARFGPVREVEKTLVLEVAFDSVHESSRHKSGVALRFPRIHRIRWDKPAQEADRLESLREFL